MHAVLRHVFGVNEDVIEVNNDTNVQKVMEYVVHEPLESSGSSVSPNGTTNHS